MFWFSDAPVPGCLGHLHCPSALKKGTIALIMRAEASLGDVLFGKARGAILALLYGQPDKQFYYRQITREISHASPGTLQRELDTLSQLGLIERFAAGNQVFYKANLKNPVYPELRGLVSKTVGVFQMLRSALEPLADRIAAAFVYGSMARRQEHAGKRH